MEDGIGDCCGVGFVGLEDEQEAFVVGCDEGGEGGDFLEGLVVFYVCEFEGSDKGCEALGAKSLRMSDYTLLFGLEDGP